MRLRFADWQSAIQQVGNLRYGRGGNERDLNLSSQQKAFAFFLLFLGRLKF
jgi:hypothetical protein